MEIMNQEIFFRNKRIIIIIMHFLHNNFFLAYNLILWEEICQDTLALRPMYLLFRSKLDVISIEVLTLGVRFVMFFCEGAEVSATDRLS